MFSCEKSAGGQKWSTYKNVIFSWVALGTLVLFLSRVVQKVHSSTSISAYFSYLQLLFHGVDLEVGVVD